MTILVLLGNDRNMNFSSTTFTGLDSIYVNRDPIYDTELATKNIQMIKLTMNH